VTGRFDPLTVSAMPILQPPRNEPQRPILLRICFFFYLFFGFVFSEKSKAMYLLLFLSFFLGLKIKNKKWAEKSKATYLLLFFIFFFWICFFGFFSPSLKLTKMKKQNKK